MEGAHGVLGLVAFPIRLDGVALSRIEGAIANGGKEVGAKTRLNLDCGARCPERREHILDEIFGSFATFYIAKREAAQRGVLRSEQLLERRVVEHNTT